MSVKIRCRRTGANNDPCFRIVAADTHFPRDGKCLEILGWYDPKKKEKNFYLDLERIGKWKDSGAQLSDMVKSLMRKAKAGAMAKPSSKPSVSAKEQEEEPADALESSTPS